MPTLLHVRLVRAVITVALTLTGAAFSQVAAFAQPIADSSILADSDLILLEEAESGAYQHYSVTLATRDGQTTLSTDKDGVVARVTVTSADALALWHEAIEHGLRTLPPEAADEGAIDASHFTVRYRVQDTEGSFSVVGVDSLPEARYRSIVRAILALASRYARARG